MRTEEAGWGGGGGGGGGGGDGEINVGARVVARGGGGGGVGKGTGKVWGAGVPQMLGSRPDVYFLCVLVSTFHFVVTAACSLSKSLCVAG